MRQLTLAILTAAVALGSGSCTDYFQGTTLVFEFDRLPVLNRVAPGDKWNPATKPDGERCADDDYAATHRDVLDDNNVPYIQPYEYHAWATINDAPVRLARFTVRECTVNNGDDTIKNAVTTISYVRRPADQYQYPKKPSVWYGVVNDIINAVPSGGATIETPVMIKDATEIFVTREAAGVSDNAGPGGTLLMRGNLVLDNQVYRATLVKVTGGASGLVTAIPADRVSAW